MLVQLTRKSKNSKTGPIPVSTTEARSCPDSCPLKAGGCYAKHGPLRFNWDKVPVRGTSWDQFCDDVAALPEGQLWRHNQAGDLPGVGDDLDTKALSALVDANVGRRGFTYTHKPLKSVEARRAVAEACLRGFTINVSYNSIEELDRGFGYALPAVVVLTEESDGRKVTRTPGGIKVVTCPATYRENVSCKDCELCYKTDRQYAIGFPVHGNGRKKANAVAEGK